MNQRIASTNLRLALRKHMNHIGPSILSRENNKNKLLFEIAFLFT